LRFYEEFFHRQQTRVHRYLASAGNDASHAA
jgi:hypothetical protein